jgi:hypothetical protein
MGGVFYDLSMGGEIWWLVRVRGAALWGRAGEALGSGINVGKCLDRYLSFHLGPNPIGSVQWQRPQVELSRGLAPPTRVRNLDELLEQLVQMS